MNQGRALIGLLMVGAAAQAVPPPIIVASRPEKPDVAAKCRGDISREQVQKLAESARFDFMEKDGRWYLIDQDLYGKAKKEARLDVWSKLLASAKGDGTFKAAGKAKDLVEGAFGMGALNFANAGGANYAAGFGATANLSFGGRQYQVVLAPHVDDATGDKLAADPLVPGSQQDIDKHKGDPQAEPLDAEPPEWNMKLVIANRQTFALNRARNLSAVVAYLLEREIEWDQKIGETRAGVLAAFKDKGLGLDAVDALKVGGDLSGLPKWAADQIANQVGNAMRSSGLDADSLLAAFMSGATVSNVDSLAYIIGCQARTGAGRSFVFYGLR